jgi:putative tricarboxylic transport membrane protein
MTAIRTSSLCLAATGGAAALAALRFGVWSAGAPGPGLFPFVAATLLLLASIGIAISGGFEAAESQPADRYRLLRYCAAIAGFAIAMKFAGTILATFCLIAGVLHWIERKPWPHALAMGFGLAMLSWWVFVFLLGVPLPQGLLEIG